MKTKINNQISSLSLFRKPVAKTFLHLVSSALLFISLIYNPVSATIVSGAVTGGDSFNVGGTFIKLSVPFTDSNPFNSVGDDNFQSSNLYGFDEGQNIDITVELAVDIIADGLGGGSGPGVVPMGSTVASHYIFYDPLLISSQIGTIEFDSNIFGIMTSTGNMSASDFLINTGVNYLNPIARGLESIDTITITGLQTITVDWTAGNPGDYIRVLTDFSPGAVVPVPAAVWLFGSGLIGLIGVTKRKKA